MLTVDNVQVNLGDATVIENVSLQVPEKEIVAVLGPNGAGKTTLFRAIVGLSPLKNGSITLENQRIDTLPIYERVQRGIAYVPEGRKLFPYMTVKDNLLMGSYLPRARRKREENLNFVYEIFPILRERESQLAGTLSGGEQQMLAIGRGLMSDPKICLLDEPSLGLAPMAAERIFQTAKTINERGVTMVIADQNVARAVELAHRASIMERGRIVATSVKNVVVTCEFPSCPRRNQGKSCLCGTTECEEIRRVLGL